MRELDDITGASVDASVRLHRDLGPGLLESVYEAVLRTHLNSEAFRSNSASSTAFPLPRLRVSA